MSHDDTEGALCVIVTTRGSQGAKELLGAPHGDKEGTLNNPRRSEGKVLASEDALEMLHQLELDWESWGCTVNSPGQTGGSTGCATSWKIPRSCLGL